VRTVEGKTVTADLVKQVLDEEVNNIRKTLGDAKFAASKFQRAKEFLWSTVQGKGIVLTYFTCCTLNCEILIIMIFIDGVRLCRVLDDVDVR
jgi:hypothetical protein